MTFTQAEIAVLAAAVQVAVDEGALTGDSAALAGRALSRLRRDTAVGSDARKALNDARIAIRARLCERPAPLLAGPVKSAGGESTR